MAALGTPICQEDMIGGQMMFSLQVLDALHRMGIHMTPDGAESYFYAWRVVGAMLGVDQDHVPPDLADGTPVLRPVHDPPHGPQSGGRAT